VTPCSDAAVKVWDIASKSLLLTREAAGVVEVEFNGKELFLTGTNTNNENNARIS
jgi:hypothetical protein